MKGGSNSELPTELSTLAIQRFSVKYKEEIKAMSFREISALMKYKHPNIIPLLGYSSSADSERVFIYEHFFNGSLADHLESTRNITNYTWVKRMKICIEIAEGLNYIHTSIPYNENNLYRTISSRNILLKDNWEAVIGVFSIFEQPKPVLDYLAGSYMPTDSSLRDRKEIDIFYFGIVLFEILCWRFADNPIFRRNNDNGLVSFVRRCFKDGTPNEILDLTLKGEAEKNIFSEGIDHNSLGTFSEIAYRCLGGNYIQPRPTTEVVLKELKRALYLQESHEDKNNLEISLADIKLATHNFRQENLIGGGGFGKVYRGNLTCAGGHKIIAAKRWDRKSDQGKTELMTELKILLEYKHMNVIDLVGYCSEKGEMIIVYEYASRGCLGRWFKGEELTWRKRLEICIDIARGLDFLHGTSDTKQEVVIHRDIKSSNILLHNDWKASIGDFGLSLISPINQQLNYVIDNAKGTPGYCDPLYITNGVLTKESDIYSVGVLLFEILCGRFVIESNSSGAQNLIDLVRYHFQKGTLNEMAFQAIKRQMKPKSLYTFQNIAYQCIHKERSKRPKANDVLMQLKRALEFQVDMEIWEPKLPSDFGNIIAMSKDICTSLHKRFLFREREVSFSLGTNGKRIEVISAADFHFKSYFRPDKWISTHESRFGQVAWIADSSMMYMHFKIQARLLSPGVNYGVNLLFKFCGPRENSDTSMDLEYHLGNKFLRSHCTTERDDGWLTKELFQFSSLAKEADIDVFLLGFSASHYVNQAIYIEGIEFQDINNMTHEEIEELKRVSIANNVQQSPIDKGHWKVNMDEVEELPANEGGHVLQIVPWLLEKCCS